jgi:hypothetical protein
MGLAIAIRKQLEGLHPDDPRSVARATEAMLIVDRYCSALQIRFRRLPRLAAAKSFPDPVAALQARLEWALVVGDRHVEFTADDDRVAARCAIDDDEMDQLLHELSTLPLKYRIDLLREQQRQKSEYNANRDAAKLASGGASGNVVDESLGARGGSGAATHGETTTPADTDPAPCVDQPNSVSAADPRSSNGAAASGTDRSTEAHWAPGSGRVTFRGHIIDFETPHQRVVVAALREANEATKSEGAPVHETELCAAADGGSGWSLRKTFDGHPAYKSILRPAKGKGMWALVFDDEADRVLGEKNKERGQLGGQLGGPRAAKTAAHESQEPHDAKRAGKAPARRRKVDPRRS